MYNMQDSTTLQRYVVHTLSALQPEYVLLLSIMIGQSLRSPHIPCHPQDHASPCSAEHQCIQHPPCAHLQPDLHLLVGLLQVTRQARGPHTLGVHSPAAHASSTTTFVQHVWAIPVQLLFKVWAAGCWIVACQVCCTGSANSSERVSPSALKQLRQAASSSSMATLHGSISMRVPWLAPLLLSQLAGA